MAQTFDCPNCGGALKISGPGATTVCGYCGNTVAIPEGLRVAPPAPPPPQVVYRERTVYVGSDEDDERTPEQQALRWGISAAVCLVMLCLWIWLGVRSDDAGNDNDTSLAYVPSATPRPVVAFDSQPVDAVITGQSISVAGRTIELLRVAVDNRARVIDRLNWTNFGTTLTVANQHFAKFVIRQSWPVELDPAVGVASSDGAAAPDLPVRVRLRLADGTVLAPSEAYAVPDDQINASDAGPRQSIQAVLFAIRRQRTLDGAFLEFRIQGREPFEIPLTTPLPPPAFPITASVPTSGPMSAPGDVFSYTVGAPVLALDLGFQRADLNERFLTVPLTLTNPSGEFAAAFTPAMVRLVADGDQREPLIAPDLTLAPGEQIMATVTFDLPAGLSQVELLLGNAALQFTSLTLPLPEDPRVGYQDSFSEATAGATPEAQPTPAATEGTPATPEATTSP